MTSHTPLLADRKSQFGAGWVDSFFDYWLPFFVDEVRRILRGPEIAKAMHEEVVSKDGVSRPAGIGKVEKAGNESTVD